MKNLSWFGVSSRGTFSNSIRTSTSSGSSTCFNWTCFISNSTFSSSCSIFISFLASDTIYSKLCHLLEVIILYPSLRTSENDDFYSNDITGTRWLKIWNKKGNYWRGSFRGNRSDLKISMEGRFGKMDYLLLSDIFTNCGHLTFCSATHADFGKPAFLEFEGVVI